MHLVCMYQFHEKFLKLEKIVKESYKYIKWNYNLSFSQIFSQMSIKLLWFYLHVFTEFLQGVSSWNFLHSGKNEEIHSSYPTSTTLCYKSTKIQAGAGDIKIGNTTPKCAAVSENFGLVVMVSVVMKHSQF